MFDYLKKKFSKKPEVKPEVKTEEKLKAKKKTDKEIATEKGEPYVAILGMDINPEDINQGAFELDWNDKFVANLIRAGYQFKPTDTDAEIVDRWFTTVCKNVALETYEQYEAMTQNRVVRSRDIGDGLSEVS